MATLKEIADLAGVSRGTVDRVLNHRGSVNPQTEKKILEIVQALGYKPNKAGIVLAAQKKNLRLGVVLLGKDTVFYDDILAGVRDKAEELEGYNCSVLLRQTDYDLTQQLDAIDELVAAGISGLAISPYNDNAVREKIDALHDQGIPVVTLNTDIENSRRLAYVGCHFYRSGETAGGLMHLMTNSAARRNVHVGIISGSMNVLCHTERIAGFRHVTETYGGIQIVEIVNNSDDETKSYELTADMLSRHPEINALYFTAGGVYGGCRAVLDSGRADQMTVITNDMVDTTREFLENGLIAATICQQPFLQGHKPLSILFTYLTTGELPAMENDYVNIDIRIRENL